MLVRISSPNGIVMRVRISLPNDLEGGFPDVSIDVHCCSRYDVSYRFVRKVIPVDERPPDRINELLHEGMRDNTGGYEYG